MSLGNHQFIPVQMAGVELKGLVELFFSVPHVRRPGKTPRFVVKKQRDVRARSQDREQCRLQPRDALYQGRCLRTAAAVVVDADAVSSEKERSPLVIDRDLLVVLGDAAQGRHIRRITEDFFCLPADQSRVAFQLGGPRKVGSVEARGIAES